MTGTEVLSGVDVTCWCGCPSNPQWWFPGVKASWQPWWPYLPTQHRTDVLPVHSPFLDSFCLQVAPSRSRFLVQRKVHTDNFSLQLWGFPCTSRDPTVFVLINKMPPTICHLPCLCQEVQVGEFFQLEESQLSPHFSTTLSWHLYRSVRKLWHVSVEKKLKPKGSTLKI